MQFLDNAIAIRPPGDQLTVGKGNLKRRIAGHHPESMIGEIEIADHFGPEHAGNVRSGRGAAAWGYFFSNAASAHDVSPLEDEGRISRARQVCGGGEAVMSCADNHCVVDRI